MSSAFAATGAAGTVKWVYHVAASLGSWSLEAHPSGQKLTATVLSSDTLRLTQQPLTFHVTHPHGVWTWRLTDLQMVGTTLTALVSD